MVVGMITEILVVKAPDIIESCYVKVLRVGMAKGVKFEVLLCFCNQAISRVNSRSIFSVFGQCLGAGVRVGALG